MREVDPNGKSANEPGAKLDAGKVRPALVIQGFRKALLAISEVGTFGAAKYTDNGWKSVPDGRKRYEDALYRHLLAEGVDEQSGLPHLAHAAWNLLAMLELELEKAKWFDAEACAEELSQAGEEVLDRLYKRMETVKGHVAGPQFTPEQLSIIYENVDMSKVRSPVPPSMVSRALGDDGKSTVRVVGDSILTTRPIG